MRKLALALAVSTAFCGVAQAQSSIVIYGIIDAAVVATTNQTAADGKKFSLDAGQLATSRFGFRGSENLGGGLKANFNLEGTLANDTGGAGSSFGGGFVNAGSSSSLFDRASWVGLSGDFGTLQLGRINILGIDSLGQADPMSLAHAGTNPNVAIAALNFGSFNGGFGANQGGTGLRQNNSVKYISPFSDGNVGFGGAFMYSFGEKAGDTSASNYTGVSGFYTDGVNGAALVYSKLKDANNLASLTAWAAGGKVKLDPALTLRLTWSQNKVDGNILIGGANANNRKLAVIGVGLDYSLSPQLVLSGAYYNTKRSGDVDGKADQYVGILKYSLSKRTTLYSSLTYAKAGSEKAQDISLALGIIGAGNSSAMRFAGGVMHAF